MLISHSALTDVIDVVDGDCTTMTAKSLIFVSILEMDEFNAQTRSL
jgi:hypothetical protein